MINYRDYFEKYEDKVIGELLDELDHLDIPRSVYNDLESVITRNIDEIMSARYESSLGDYEDEQYERYKEEQLL